VSDGLLELTEGPLMHTHGLPTPILVLLCLSTARAEPLTGGPQLCKTTSASQGCGHWAAEQCAGIHNNRYPPPLPSSHAPGLPALVECRHLPRLQAVQHMREQVIVEVAHQQHVAVLLRPLEAVGQAQQGDGALHAVRQCAGEYLPSHAAPPPALQRGG